MKEAKLIIIGENIHCTRIFKTDGKFIEPGKDGVPAIAYKLDGLRKHLPVPVPFLEREDWKKGKVKHCAVAIWQGVYGEGAAREAGTDYIHALALKQERAGAAYLDINLDEFSTDKEERCKLMRWTVRQVQEASALPVAIDSSNEEIMRAGLEACDSDRARPLINSISLERRPLLPLAREYEAPVVASAAGERGLPANHEERLKNISELMALLRKSGLADNSIYIDPLVLPTAGDMNNGHAFLEAVKDIRKAFGSDLHITGGLSNISFGMPKRSLINRVFTHLAMDEGLDSGIVDPLQINNQVLQNLDRDSEAFQLARAMLMGEDFYGMKFIQASREGRI